MVEQQAPKLAYTIAEAVAATGISRAAIYRDLKAGNLIARKRGATTLIRTEDLQAYLAALPVAGKELH